MLDQEQFFSEYKVKKEFEDSGLEWSVLEAIYDDFCGRQEELEQCCRHLEEHFLKDMTISIHSIRTRAKNPRHLIEKIIRKRGKDQSTKYIGIDVSNYREIIHDLIGARILILAKEEWEGVFDWMMEKFPGSSDDGIYMAERPMAFTRYGDRDIYGNKIYKEHTSRGYRSQHYVVKIDGYFCEVQVRTLAEEVYGEFDHRVKYPYRNDNHFLLRYTNTVAQLTDSIDEIISTCFEMGEQGWESCDQYYKKDTYADWKHIAQNEASRDGGRSRMETTENQLDVVSYANAILLRKDR